VINADRRTDRHNENIIRDYAKAPKNVQHKQCTYEVTLKRVRVTIFAFLKTVTVKYFECASVFVL
jgi:hypothetical protein